MKFVSSLNIRKVGGIGNVQEQLLKGIGVNTCRDLYEKRAEIRYILDLQNCSFIAENCILGSYSVILVQSST